MSLGTKINYYRQQSGMTQEQLAERMNVTRQTVSNWERGINEPDFAGLCRLAEEFGITLNDFAEGSLTDAPTGGEQSEERGETESGKGFTQTSAGILDGAALFAGAFALLRLKKPNPILVMAGCGALGLILYLIAGA